MASEMREGFFFVRRGYDPAEVDDYIERMRVRLLQAEERAITAESALNQNRAELASPGTGTFSKRLDAILELANEEAAEIRAQAKVDGEALLEQAAGDGRRILDELGVQRDAMQRDISELSAKREKLLSQLAELHDAIGETRARYQEHPSGEPPPSPEDADTRPLSDLDPDTEILTSRGRGATDTSTMSAS